MHFTGQGCTVVKAVLSSIVVGMYVTLSVEAMMQEGTATSIPLSFDAAMETWASKEETCEAGPDPEPALGLLQHRTSWTSLPKRTALEEESLLEASAMCESWCKDHKTAGKKTPLAKKCKFKKCKGCPECANQQKTPKPITPPTPPTPPKQNGKKKGGGKKSKGGGKKKKTGGKKNTNGGTTPSKVNSSFPIHSADALKNCVSKLKPSGGECVLEGGIYPITSSLSVTGKKGVIRAKAGAKVYLDGTKELQPKWKPCKNVAAFKDRCAKGVWAATISDDIFQLFVAGENSGDKPEEREMLVPARWPNKKPKPSVMAADAPSWVSIFDTKKTWSFVKTAEHGKDKTDKGHGKGSLEDDGGNTRTMHVEVEEDMWEDVTISGDQYLKDANIDATGAVIVVAWGKQMSEQGLVRKHNGNKLEFDKIPCPGGNIVPYRVPPYTSCHSRPFVKMKDGVEQGMLSYFLTQKLELLDQEGEWHFEPQKTGGGTLFVKLQEHPSKYRFWGRVGDLALKVYKSSAVQVRDLTFFASRFEAHHSSNLKLTDNTFLYSSHAQRALLNPKETGAKVPRLYSPESNYLMFVDKAEITGNVFRYSEGKAISFEGEGAKFLDNLAEFNGWNGIDGPATVKVGRKNYTKVLYNTLRWNGHVSGLFNLAPLSTFEYNRVERQNFGKLQHDGAGIHVVISGQSSTFRYNWIYNGDHSLMIRTDTAKTTTLEEVGRKGTMSYNVGWGGPMLVIKGDEHTIEHNTVLGPLQVVVSFGAACGMNTNSKVNYNAAFTIAARGSCTDDDGKKFDSLPEKKKGNIDKADLCESLRSCDSFDFRPKGTLLQKQGGEAGAYASGDKVYFIPGRRLSVPQSPIPKDGGKVILLKTLKTSVIFQPAKDCKKHTVYFGPDKKKVGLMSGCSKQELTDGANILDIQVQSMGVKPWAYYWRVEPSGTDCPGASVSPVWTFSEKNET